MSKVINRGIKILLSNDDGVYAPGLKALYDALKDIAVVKVIAPDRDRSASSKALTLNKPIYSMELDNGFMLIDGTPTDSIHYALTCTDFIQGFADPDMIVAGINKGPNLGDDVLYSGTVAVATEGRFLGFPSVAMSLAGEGKHFDTAGVVAKNIITKLIESPLEKNTILNVNIPDVPYEQLKGYKVTRLGSREKANSMIKMADPRGKIGHWIGLLGKIQDAREDTDFFAVQNRYVSITPLKMDITHYERIDAVGKWAKELDHFEII